MLYRVCHERTLGGGNRGWEGSAMRAGSCCSVWRCQWPSGYSVGMPVALVVRLLLEILARL